MSSFPCNEIPILPFLLFSIQGASYLETFKLFGVLSFCGWCVDCGGVGRGCAAPLLSSLLSSLMFMSLAVFPAWRWRQCVDRGTVTRCVSLLAGAWAGLYRSGLWGLRRCLPGGVSGSCRLPAGLCRCWLSVGDPAGAVAVSVVSVGDGIQRVGPGVSLSFK